MSRSPDFLNFAYRLSRLRISRLIRTLRSVSEESNPGRCGPASFRPGHFGHSRFGQLFGRVVSALVGGSFRP